MIVFEQVVKNFGAKNHVQVLKGVDMEIRRGEWVSVLGPSGCGKSTLLNLAACLLKPNSGRITIAGKDTAGLNERQLNQIRNQKIGFIFQGAYLLPTLTILDNVMLPGKFTATREKANHKKDRTRAMQLLKQFDMGDRLNYLPHELSYGQKRRAAIARALMNHPDIILADEPTNDLDPARALRLANELKSLQEQGYTILTVTHNREFSLLAGRQLMIEEGLLKPAV